MGASSVTGVGKGAALGMKGPGNKRDQFVPLAAPHIVASGVTYLSSTTGTVTLSEVLPLTPDRYAVVCSAGTLTSNASGKPVLSAALYAYGVPVDVNGYGAYTNNSTTGAVSSLAYASSINTASASATGTSAINLVVQTGSCYVTWMVIQIGAGLDVNAGAAQNNAVPGVGATTTAVSKTGTGAGYQFP